MDYGKLIELLNEFEEKRIDKINSEGKLFVKLSFRPYTESAFKENSVCAEIISKYYGFIKRLVDNDKIDFQKNKLQVLKDIDVRGEVIYDYTLFDKTDGVLMLLAISDTPIDDLISYLR